MAQLADPKFISPMVDFGFKTLFGTQRNINLLRRMLEMVFKCRIPDIQFINIEHQGDTEEDRKAFFDVACRSDDGREFIVEVQLKRQEFLYVMKNLPTFATRPDGLSDKFFNEFFEAAEFASLPAEDKKTYRKTMGTVNDYLNTIDYAREEGRVEGRVEGREEERVETARRMLAEGMSMETITKITTLSAEQVKAL